MYINIKSIKQQIEMLQMAKIEFQLWNIVYSLDIAVALVRFAGFVNQMGSSVILSALSVVCRCNANDVT